MMSRKNTIPIADRMLTFTLNSGGRCSGTRRNLLRNHRRHKFQALEPLPTKKSQGKDAPVERCLAWEAEGVATSLPRRRPSRLDRCQTCRTFSNPTLPCEHYLLCSPSPP